MRPVVDLNIGPRPVYPTIKIGRPDNVDVDSLVKNVATLVPMGLKVGMSTMRDRMGLPDPEDGEELLTAPSAPAPVAPQPPPADQTGLSAAGSVSRHGHAHTPDAIDTSVAKILAGDGWEPMVAPVVAGLEQEIAGATSIDEVRAILKKRADNLDVATMTELLARASFRARLAGEADEDLA